jgi:hypothetical protein
MTLTIHKLSTRCRSPKGFERPGALVDDVARGPLASELGAYLGPSLDRLPAVTRLKDLRVRLKIPARNLNAMALSSAWARAFTLALHRALAYPPGDGTVSSRRYESDAAYTAAMLHHIATKGLAPSWEFPELEACRGSTPAEAALGILLKDPKLIPEITAQLDRRGWLEPLLALWDELSLERVIQTVAGGELRPPGLSLEHLIELGQAAAAAGGLRREWAFAGRRQTIRLWVRLHPRFPLRGVWHGLRLLRRFLELPSLLILRDPSLLADAIPFPPWCEAIVSAGAIPPADSPSFATPAPSGLLASASVSAPAASSISAGRAGTSLLSVLEGLRPLLPSAAISISTSPAGTSVKWIVSSCAGVLLMLSTVQRLNLWRFVRNPEFVRFGGPRALSFLLAGAGMNLLNRWSFTDPVEPAVALLAGMFSEPDLVGMRQFFSEADVSSVAEFVQAENWTEALDRAATELSHSFASRVRGFRNASREAVVKQFIRIHGRVLVEESRLLVVLDPTPWAVALHLSGMDEPIEGVEWLGWRRVEFVLEGL